MRNATESFSDSPEDIVRDRRRSRRPRRQLSVAAAFRHPLADYGFLLGTTIIILIIGLIMVLSASTVYSYQNYDSSYYMFTRQLLFAVIGFVSMMILSRQSPAKFQKYSTVMLIVAFGLLMAVFVPGIGQTVNGQRNWIKLFGPFNMQPSEFAKWALLVWTASLIAKRRDMVDGWRSLLVPLVPVAGIMIGLVLAEGDLGTDLVMMPMIAAILLVAGAPLRLFAWAGAGVAMLIVLMSIAAPYRIQRFASWLDPASDPTGTGWQVLHGQYALATGGWWGVGLGGSREKWGFLPEAQTDFILAVIGEELGLVGTLSIVLLFVLLAIMITRIAFRTDDDFVRLATTGVGIWIVTQAIINIGAVLGALPIAGLPLPLVSYGGSSLMFTLMAIGMVLSFARNQPDAQEFLATRKAAKQAARPGRKNRKKVADDGFVPMVSDDDPDPPADRRRRRSEPRPEAAKPSFAAKMMALNPLTKKAGEPKHDKPKQDKPRHDKPKRGKSQPRQVDVTDDAMAQPAPTRSRRSSSRSSSQPRRSSRSSSSRSSSRSDERDEGRTSGSSRSSSRRRRDES